MVYTCTNCNKEVTRKYPYPGSLCQSCYKYFQSGGKKYPLPKAGVIEKDKRGYVICHICGQAYRRLGSHVKESHNMTISEYKKEFGLCECCRTTEDDYSGKMREHAYRNNMPERLLISGMNTRIKTGERDKRFGKKTRLQETLNKRKRVIANENS